jgi:hypothetical protein
MTNLMNRCVALLCFGVIPVLAQGVCSEQTVRGTYGLSCEGYLTPAPGAGLVPVTILGTCKQNATGQATCQTKLSLAGTILDQEVAGQLSVQSDCTGSSTLTQKIQGQPAPTLHMRFFILDSGKHLKAMALDEGTVLKCTKDRISFAPWW